MPTRAPRSPNPLRWLTAERLKARKHAKHNPPACGCATPNPQRLTREEFDRRYWKVAPDTPQGAAGVPASTRREFYSDYRESGLSFAAYVKATTSLQHNPKDRSLTERAMLMRERLHRMDAVADDYLRPRDERTVRGKAAHAYRLKLAAVNHELGQGMSETSEAWRAWRKEKGAPAVRNPAVTPAGWRNTTASSDGYRVYARQDGNLEMAIDGFEPETCNRLGLPVLWNWSVSVISGPYKQRHGTAPALKLAVARVEAAAKKLGSTKARTNVSKRNPTDPALIERSRTSGGVRHIDTDERGHVLYWKGEEFVIGDLPSHKAMKQIDALSDEGEEGRIARNTYRHQAKVNPFRPELVRKGGAVYGYGVWDETANDYVKRAGKPFMTDRGGMASALAKRMTARERGERPARVTVTPTRAQQIIAAARRTAVGPWSDSLDAHMSPGERAYVNAVWNRMSGSASFVSALMAIANGQVPAKGRIS